MIPVTDDIMSLGRIVCDLGTTHGAALRCIDVLKIQPAMRINGVPHYGLADVTLLGHHLNSGDLPKRNTTCR